MSKEKHLASLLVDEMNVSALMKSIARNVFFDACIHLEILIGSNIKLGFRKTATYVQKCSATNYTSKCSNILYFEA